METVIMVGQLLLALSLLVGLHELGHLVAARMFGMRVEQYFIGFPPKVVSFRKGETEYGLGAIPLGGFVKISGMIDESLDTAQMNLPPQPYEFRAKPAWQRLVVMMGGIIVNIITGIVIFTALMYSLGSTYIANQDAKFGIVALEYGKQIGLKTGDRIVEINGKPFDNIADITSPDVLLGTNSFYTVERPNAAGSLERIRIDVPNNLAEKFSSKETAGQFVAPVFPFDIAEVQLGSEAEKAGLKVGDRITSINGKPTAFFHEVQEAVRGNKGKTITMGLQRGNESVTIRPTVSPEGTIGFFPNSLLKETHVDYTFGEAVSKGTERAFGVIYDNIRGFGKIFKGEVSASKALSGPVGIARMFGGVWDWTRFWSLAGLLSMALAFFNALPIPALDGGHGAMLIYEMVSGRKPSDKFVEGAQRVGMVLLLGLMAFAFLNDIFFK
ncbi:RIP metalloprotease RseP [Fibrella sp. ES10-3-2-2]|nr:RIP metalloprotease RseP [Fibrella sp. ES10-3-2-2]